MGRKRSSLVWQHVTESPDRTTITCHVCNKTLTHGGTGNIESHFSKLHPEIYEEIALRKELRREERQERRAAIGFTEEDGDSSNVGVAHAWSESAEPVDETLFYGQSSYAHDSQAPMKRPRGRPPTNPAHPNYRPPGHADISAQQPISPHRPVVDLDSRADVKYAAWAGANAHMLDESGLEFGEENADMLIPEYHFDVAPKGTKSDNSEDSDWSLTGRTKRKKKAARQWAGPSTFEHEQPAPGLAFPRAAGARGRPRVSSVWKFFEKVDDKAMCTCPGEGGAAMCGSVMLPNSNNMALHLLRKHYEFTGPVLQTGDYKCVPAPATAIKRMGLDSRTPKKSLSSSYRQSNAAPHKADERYALMLASLDPDTSSKICEDDLFVELVRELNPRWTPPTFAATLRLQDKLTSKLRTYVAEQLRYRSRIAVCFHSDWSSHSASANDVRRALCTLTGHWYDTGDGEPKYACMGVRRMPVNSESVAAFFADTWEQYDLSLSQVLRVLVGGRPIRTFDWRDAFGERALPCYHAALKNCISSASVSRSSSELQMALAGARVLATRVAQSPSGVERLPFKLETLEGTPEEQDTWIAPYRLCEQLSKSRKVVDEISNELGLTPLDDGTWAVIAETERAFRPLAKYVGLSARRAPVLLSEVIATHEVLQAHWAQTGDADWSPAGARLCGALSGSVAKALAYAVAPGSQHFDATPAAATLLDPRVRAMLKQDMVDIAKQCILTKLTAPSSGVPSPNQNGHHGGSVKPTVDKKFSDDPDAIMERLLERSYSKKPQKTLADELDSFVASDARLRTSDDALAWWFAGDGCTRWPNLSAVALDLLTMPASIQSPLQQTAAAAPQTESQATQRQQKLEETMGGMDDDQLVRMAMLRFNKDLLLHCI